jgi:hypothetical protein
MNRTNHQAPADSPSIPGLPILSGRKEKDPSQYELAIISATLAEQFALKARYLAVEAKANALREPERYIRAERAHFSARMAAATAEFNRQLAGLMFQLDRPAEMEEHVRLAIAAAKEARDTLDASLSALSGEDPS